jgi:ribosomal protein L32
LTAAATSATFGQDQMVLAFHDSDGVAANHRAVASISAIWTNFMDFGIAIYVAGAGVAVALVGSLILLRSAKQSAPDLLVAARAQAATKKCPDCAETVLAEARVCKHCGYRFAPAASSEPGSTPPAPKQSAPRIRPPERIREHHRPRARPNCGSVIACRSSHPGIALT